MNINYKKGFTLIELLVVIAIIGILSSVVLASLNSARAKGSDAAIKGNLNGTRAQAELYYDSNSSKYATTDTVTGCNTANSIFADSNVKNAVEQAATQSGTGAVCVASTTGWAISARLKSDIALAYCVDGRGNATTTAWDSVNATGELADPNGCL
jgi:prepilin-type N-terminal cleavage/methylation domain-containing protein